MNPKNSAGGNFLTFSMLVLSSKIMSGMNVSLKYLWIPAVCYGPTIKLHPIVGIWLGQSVSELLKIDESKYS